MNVAPWHRLTAQSARTPLRRSARPSLECLEERITPTRHNVMAGPFPVTAPPPNAHANLPWEGTPLSAGATLLNASSATGLLDLGTRKAQPLASPVSPASGSSGGSGSANDGATAPIPSLFQAWQSLFLDGAFLEAENLANQFVSNIDEFGLVPSVTTDAVAKAAAAGVDFNAVLALLQYLGTVKDFQTILPDIEFNLQYAGPFGLAVGMAGATAAYQAVQIPPMSSPSSDMD